MSSPDLIRPLDHIITTTKKNFLTCTCGYSYQATSKVFANSIEERHYIHVGKIVPR